MTTDIKQIGEIFKAKRKELNISLKEAASSTSIRLGYLQAIEEGDQKQFLSSVYTIGFMKQYASFLGVNVDELIQENPNLFNQSGEKHEFDYGIGTLETRGTLGGGVKWLPNLIWASCSVVVLLLAYYLAKYLNVI